LTWEQADMLIKKCREMKMNYLYLLNLKTIDPSVADKLSEYKGDALYI